MRLREIITRLDNNQLSVIRKHQHEIPVKIGSIAEDFGLTVVSATLDIGISGEIFLDNDSVSGYKVRVNRHEVRSRQRFTIAHEISHYLLHRDLIGCGLSHNILYRSSLTNELEREANALAAEILMPIALIKTWRKQNGYSKRADYIAPMALAFGVSEEALSVRLELGVK